MANTAFHRAEQRINSAAVARLSNAIANFGAQDIAVIFDDSFAIGGVGIGMAGSQPAIQMLTSLVPSSPQGQPVQVDAVSYTVASHQPDGNGWSTLLLEVA